MGPSARRTPAKLHCDKRPAGCHAAAAQRSADGRITEGIGDAPEFAQTRFAVAADPPVHGLQRHADAPGRPPPATTPPLGGCRRARGRTPHAPAPDSPRQAGRLPRPRCGRRTHERPAPPAPRPIPLPRPSPPRPPPRARPPSRRVPGSRPRPPTVLAAGSLRPTPAESRSSLGFLKPKPDGIPWGPPGAPGEPGDLGAAASSG